MPPFGGIKRKLNLGTVCGKIICHWWFKPGSRLPRPVFILSFITLRSTLVLNVIHNCDELGKINNLFQGHIAQAV
jgi:hypothetical protein